MINKDIITIILGIIYLSDIYKINNLFELNNRNIVIIILIIQIINKLYTHEHFTQTNNCEPGFDCSCTFSQDVTENTKLYNSISYALSNMQDVLINGDLTVNGDLEILSEDNAFRKMSIDNFNINGSSNLIDISRKNGDGNVFMPLGDFKKIECGGVSLKEKIDQVTTFVNNRAESLDPVINGNLTVKNNVYVKGQADATNDGRKIDNAPFVTNDNHLTKTGGSSFVIWGDGFEYWKSSGGHFSEW